MKKIFLFLILSVLWSNAYAQFNYPLGLNSTNWDTAYTDRLKWDGGATGLTAATGRTSLGLVIGTNVQIQSATLDSIIANTWIGRNSITTLGTITTGTWNATAISTAKGGTGAVNASAARDSLGLGTMATEAATTYLPKTAVRDSADAAITANTTLLLKTAARDSADAAIAANTTHLLKTAVRDSADAAIAANTTHMLKTAVRDSANAAITANTTLLPKTSVRDSADAAIAANTTHMLKTAFPDSGDALLARADSSNIGAGKLAISDIAALSTRLSEKQESSTAMLKAAARDSANAAISANTTHLLKAAVRDSANAAITANTTLLPKTAVRDSANAAITANTTHMLKTAFPDSGDALLARADSTKIGDGKLAVADINQLATLMGLRQLASAFYDSLLAHTGREWLVPLPDYRDTTASAQDSTTVKAIFDIDGVKGQKKKLLVYGNASTTTDSTVWGNTFYPQDSNPDSLYFYVATTDSSKTSVSVEIINDAGAVLFSSGTVTNTNSNVFERKVFVFTSFATLDEHAVVYRIRTTTAAMAVQIGQVYFKRL